MKANQRFVNDDDGVSPVIAVILMVAITVVLAATVYLWVSGFGNNTQNVVQATFAAKSVDLPAGLSGGAATTDADSQDDSIQLTYTAGQADLSSNEVAIIIDGVKLCPTTASSSNGFANALATAAASGATCGTGVPASSGLVYCTNLPAGATAGSGFTWARGASLYLWHVTAAGTSCTTFQSGSTGLLGTHQLQIVGKSQVLLDTTLEVHQ